MQSSSSVVEDDDEPFVMYRLPGQEGSHQPVSNTVGSGDVPPQAVAVRHSARDLHAGASNLQQSGEMAVASGAGSIEQATQPAASRGGKGSQSARTSASAGRGNGAASSRQAAQRSSLWSISSSHLGLTAQRDDQLMADLFGQVEDGQDPQEARASARSPNGRDSGSCRRDGRRPTRRTAVSVEDTQDVEDDDSEDDDEEADDDSHLEQDINDSNDSDDSDDDDDDDDDDHSVSSEEEGEESEVSSHNSESGDSRSIHKRPRASKRRASRRSDRSNSADSGGETLGSDSLRSQSEADASEAERHCKRRKSKRGRSRRRSQQEADAGSGHLRTRRKRHESSGTTMATSGPAFGSFEKSFCDGFFRSAFNGCGLDWQWDESSRHPTVEDSKNYTKACSLADRDCSALWNGEAQKAERKLFSVRGVHCVGCALDPSRLTHVNHFVMEQSHNKQGEALWRMAEDIYRETVQRPCADEHMHAPQWAWQDIRTHYVDHVVNQRLTRIQLLKELRAARSVLVSNMVTTDDDGNQELDKTILDQFLKVAAMESKELSLVSAADSNAARASSMRNSSALVSGPAQSSASDAHGNE